MLCFCTSRFISDLSNHMGHDVTYKQQCRLDADHAAFDNDTNHTLTVSHCQACKAASGCPNNSNNKNKDKNSTIIIIIIIYIYIYIINIIINNNSAFQLMIRVLKELPISTHNAMLETPAACRYSMRVQNLTFNAYTSDTQTFQDKVSGCICSSACMWVTG